MFFSPQEINAQRAGGRAGSSIVDKVVEVIEGSDEESSGMGWSWDQEQSRQQTGTRSNQRQQRQTREDKASGKGTVWEKPAASVPKTRASLNNRAWWTDEVPFWSAFCQQAAHTPSSISYYTTLHCTALQGQVAVLIAWEGYGGQREGLSPLCVSKASSVMELCVDQRAFHRIGSLWLIPCVCEHDCVCRTKLPVTFISTLVVLWSVWAADRGYQRLTHSSITWI